MDAVGQSGAAHQWHRWLRRREVEYAAGEIEKSIGIGRWPHAGMEHEIVGGKLGVAGRERAEHPHEWIEPVDGAGDHRDGACDNVGAPHVGQLVQEDDAELVVRPFAGRDRNQDHRMNNSGCERYVDLRRFQHGYIAAGPQ